MRRLGLCLLHPLEFLSLDHLTDIGRLRLEFRDLLLLFHNHSIQLLNEPFQNGNVRFNPYQPSFICIFHVSSKNQRHEPFHDGHNGDNARRIQCGTLSDHLRERDAARAVNNGIRRS